MRYRAYLLLPLAPLMGSVALIGQTPTAVSQTPTTARTVRPDAIEGFLARKEAEQRNRSDLFARNGQPDLIGQVRAIVASSALRRPSPNVGANDQQLARLHDSFQIEVAQALARFGFNPADVRKQPDAIEAVAGLIRSTASAEQLALLADAVFIGTVDSYTSERLGDGFNSSVRFRDVRVLKGPPAAASYVLRQESGKISASETLEVSDDVTERGKRYLLLLSRSLYQNSLQTGPREVGRGRSLSGERVLKFGAWYEVTADGRVVPAAPALPPIADLEAFAQRIN